MEIISIRIICHSSLLSGIFSFFTIVLVFFFTELAHSSGLPDQRSTTIEVEKLVADKVLYLGRAADSPKVFASLEAIKDDDFLRYVRGRKNAIVMSQFLYADPGDDLHYVEFASVGRAIYSKLVSSEAEQELLLENTISQAGTFYSGQILHLMLYEGPLDMPTNVANHFPITDIFIILFEHGEGTEDKARGIFKGLKSVAKLSRDRGIENLVVPPLTYWNMDNNRVELDTLFDAIYEGAKSSGYSQNLIYSLYSQWHFQPDLDEVEFYGNPLDDSINALIRLHSKFNGEGGSE